MAGIAQRLTRRVEIQLDGRAWPILFTHDVLLDIEDACGLSILKGELQLYRASARGLRAVLCVALRHAGREWTLADAGRLLGSIRMGEIRTALWTAWAAAMPEREPEIGAGAAVQSWMEAWAIARIDLGLGAEEWRAMTPRMVQALSRQRLENLRQREFLHSRAIASAANYSACHPKEPFTDDHFMLHPWPKEASDQEPDRIDGTYIMNRMARARALAKRA